MPQPDAGVDAVAVCLLHADVEPTHEAAVVADLEAAGWDVSASHLVTPEFREYERMATTVLNAALRTLQQSNGYLEYDEQPNKEHRP